VEGERLTLHAKLDDDAVTRRGGAMFDGQAQRLAASAEIEFESPQPWSSEEPRKAWPARACAAPLRAW
jgi:hypothetical protein